MEERMKISEAELEVLQVLWEAEKPLKIQDVCDRLENKKWKYNTVGTLLLRMAEKGAVVSEKKNRIIYYRPVWEREAYQKEQTETLIDRLYHGSAKELAVSLFQGGNMTKEDLDDIRKMFDL